MRAWSAHASLVTAAAIVLALVSAPEAADPWRSGEYRDFTPAAAESTTGVKMRVTKPAVKLHQATVHRPKVNIGEDALLRADYEVAAPSGEIDVRETRVVRYNGARLAELTRVTSRGTGRVGSEYQLRIPDDAAPGLYTVTTTVEPVKGAGPPAKRETASAVFYVADATAGAQPDEDDTSSIKIRIWSEKAKYRAGEPLRLLFETNRDAYVTLVNIGTTGGVTILYPNRFSADNRVKAGTVYRVPGSGDNYEIALNGPAGVELVYALVTTQPLKFNEADFGGGALKPSGRPDLLTRDLNVTARRLPVKEHTKALLEIEVE